MEQTEVIEKNQNELMNSLAEFQNQCPNCLKPSCTSMNMMEIPFFKKIVITCSACDSCGLKSSSIKYGGGISAKGVQYTLKIRNPSDLNREIIISENATLEIPEIDFYMNSGSLGGKFTTLEGILRNAITQLRETCPFSFTGDEYSRKKAILMEDFLDKLELIQNGKMLDVTVILDDPSGKSYLQVDLINFPNCNFSNIFKESLCS